MNNILLSIGELNGSYCSMEKFILHFIYVLVCVCKSGGWMAILFGHTDEKSTILKQIRNMEYGLLDFAIDTEITS